MKPSSGAHQVDAPPRRAPPPSPTPSTAAGTGSASSSPFICLSAQCDLLYRIGPRVHPYAVITEQSAFQRAADQLRFVTPSPLAWAAHASRSAPSPSAATLGAVEASQGLLALPHIRVADHLPAPFQRIADFEEAAQRAASARSAAGTAVTSAPASPGPDELVPSGVLLARRAYCTGFERLPAHAAPLGDPLASVAAAASPAAPPQPAEAPTPPVFPAPVLLRAVAQMVLSMQAAAPTASAAARFSCASYRGVSLSRAVPPHTPRRSAEALVFSVLPQVVADRLAAVGAGPATDAATRFMLRPSQGPAGFPARKRVRDEPQTQPSAEGAVAAVPAASVVAGLVWCERVTSSLSEGARGDAVATRYGAVSAEAYERWSAAPVGGGGGGDVAAVNSADAAAAALYTAEDAWISEGIFQPLFTRPADAPATAAVADLAENAGSDGRPAGPGSVSDALFLKTSAFLLLAFLVHHSWCTYITAAVTRALGPHRLAQQALQVAATHVTCLPAVLEVRRPPQYEWRSTLIFHVQRTVDEVAHETSPDVGCKSPALFRLAVQVHNRSAELTWWRLPGASLADSIAPAGTAVLRESVTTSGTLDDLLQHI